MRRMVFLIGRWLYASLLNGTKGFDCAVIELYNKKNINEKNGYVKNILQ
jgi:hypothetical protein